MGGVFAVADVLSKVEDVATSVGVAPSTIRKYSKIIENHNYKFSRNNQNALMFDSEEVNMFKELVEYKKDGYSVDEAVKLVIPNIVSTSETASTSDVAMQNMVDRADIGTMLTTMAEMRNDMKLREEQLAEQLKLHEMKMAEKMQDILEEHNKRIEREMKTQLEVKMKEVQEMKEMKDSLKRIEDQTAEKSPWWKFW